MREMTEREKAQARWRALQEDDWKNNRFPEFVIFMIILNIIFG